MNKKAEFNIQGMIIGMLVVSLFVGIIGATINQSSSYDSTGFDEDSINKYSSPSLLTDLETIESQADAVVVDKNLFDYFAGIWNKLTSPFKTVYRSYSTVQSLTSDAVDDLNLLPIFKDFAVALIVVLVIIGIVMIKFYLARKK